MINKWRHDQFYRMGDVGRNQDVSDVVSQASHRDNVNVRR